MYTTKREQQRFRFQNDAKTPSFSSTLLDKIYRSIDESNDMKLYHETMGKKQSRVVVQEEEITAASIRRACLLEKWNRSEKVGTQWKTQTEGKTRWHHHRHHEHDQEVMFFSSTSSSSDSSSGLLSSSDTESLYPGLRSKSRVSCFAPPRPKPVMTSASNEEGLIKSKSRALKIYNNLKKVKQPISPGGKLSNFLNSLFATGGSVKKTKTYDDTKAPKSGQDSTCSSASSFSRSCLSKATPSSSKDKLRDGVKRTVRFYPVSVILNEDSRPCGHKCLYEEDTSVMAWKIGRKKNEDEELRVVDNSRRKEEAAREFLKDYHGSQKKSDLINVRDFTNLDDDDDDDDDAASCSSSDLFELDHLSVMGNNRYREELPVYETTYVSTNHAIANGLI